MDNKKSTNSHQNQSDTENANILRMLELRAIAMLMDEILKVVTDTSKYDNRKINLPALALSIIEYVNYGDNPREEREQIEAMIISLKINVNRCKTQLNRKNKNIVLGDNTDRAYAFLSELVRGVVDSTAVVTDTYKEDASKIGGVEHRIQVQINFNGDAWLFEFIDINKDNSIEPDFVHHGGLLIKTTLNGNKLTEQDDAYVGSALSLLALAIKKERQSMHEIEACKSDKKLVERAKKFSKVEGGHYTEHLVFFKRLVDTVVRANSINPNMSIESFDKAIRSILKEEVAVNGHSIKHVMDVLAIDEILNPEPKA